MSGFEFRYRLDGGPPTVRRFRIKGPQTVTRGDIVNLERGEVDLAATMDTKLLGVSLETKAGSSEPADIEIIVDGDAVYSVDDSEARRRGDYLDVNGLTGAQGVSGGLNQEFMVVVDSPAGDPTLVRIRYGKHGSPAEGADESEARARLNAAVARAVTRVFRSHVGRGPTKAEAFFRRHIVVVVMEDVMTREEHSLAAGGKTETVHEVHNALQGTMKEDLVRAVEELTDRKVVAFMSDSQVRPDFASEVFVLDGPVLMSGPRP
ncbi:MAG TPA: DUF2294 domain-containing protein [Thermoleophilaceae bacterium]